MTTPVSTDYGAAVGAANYMLGIAEHPDIAQADAGILRLIEEAHNSYGWPVRVLDLGCGPGRLTSAIPGIPGSESWLGKVVGLDASQSFIAAAKARDGDRIDYHCRDFLWSPPEQKFHICVMQGVLHHVPAENRQAWFEQCRKSLVHKGLLIVGDEFIPDYDGEQERKLKAVGWYAYVIASALRCNNQALADVECQNMIDDVAVGTAGAGRSSEEIVAVIKDRSERLYASFFHRGARSQQALLIEKRLLEEILYFAEHQADVLYPSLDRGDRKISMDVLEEELVEYGFAKQEILRYGPVGWIGGMGVISCIKQPDED